MKIGVISDTHIPVCCNRLPKAVGKNFKDVDMILHAGDLIELSVLEELTRICPNVIAVCGNMDLAAVQALLPRKKIIHAGKFSIGLIHSWGAPSNVLETIRDEFDNVDAVVFGHSHKPLMEKINNILFFNPGSATDKIFAEKNSIGILEVNDIISGKIIII